MSDIQLLPLNGELFYTFDFTDEIPSGISITQIDYVVPAQLVQFADSDDLANKKGTAGFRKGATGAHGQTLVVEAKAITSSSPPEKIPKYLTIRID